MFIIKTDTNTITVLGSCCTFLVHVLPTPPHTIELSCCLTYNKCIVVWFLFYIVISSFFPSVDLAVVLGILNAYTLLGSFSFHVNQPSECFNCLHVYAWVGVFDLV